MSKDSRSGLEIYAYVAKSAGLVSIRDDGTTWVNSGSKWKRYSHLKDGADLGQWKERKAAVYATLEPWQKGVKSVPTTATLERWMDDGICKTPSGHRVEPDGHGPDGSPSWLLLLGMI